MTASRALGARDSDGEQLEAESWEYRSGLKCHRRARVRNLAGSRVVAEDAARGRSRLSAAAAGVPVASCSPLAT